MKTSTSNFVLVKIQTGRCVCFGTAHAATLTVTTTANTKGFCAPGGCSVREAIAAAALGDEIVFASPPFGRHRPSR